MISKETMDLYNGNKFIDYYDTLKEYRLNKNGKSDKKYAYYLERNLNKIIKEYDYHVSSIYRIESINTKINRLIELIYGTSNEKFHTVNMYEVCNCIKSIEDIFTRFKLYICNNYIEKNDTEALDFVHYFVYIGISKRNILRRNINYLNDDAFIYEIEIRVGRNTRLCIPFVYNTSNVYLNKELTDKVYNFSSVVNAQYIATFTEVLEKHRQKYEDTVDTDSNTFTTHIANAIMKDISEIPLPEAMYLKSNHCKLDTKITFDLSYSDDNCNDSDVDYIYLDIKLEILVDDEHVLFANDRIIVDEDNISSYDTGTDIEDLLSFVRELREENILTTTIKY